MVEFEDYTAANLMELLKKRAARELLELDGGYLEAAGRLFERWIASKAEDFGNAHIIRTLLKDSNVRRVKRLSAICEGGGAIAPEDMPLARQDLGELLLEIS
jgi:hypothetical protein